jgi:hypothetical protein
VLLSDSILNAEVEPFESYRINRIDGGLPECLAGEEHVQAATVIDVLLSGEADLGKKSVNERKANHGIDQENFASTIITRGHDDRATRVNNS